MATKPAEAGTGRCKTDLTLRAVRDLLDADVLWWPEGDTHIDGIAAADLMSDVLTQGRPGVLLLTGLASVQAIRTAAVVDLAGVVFVHGKRPADEVVALARENSIPVLSTARSLFEAAGLLYEALWTDRQPR